jgi:hypothetical protein
MLELLAIMEEAKSERGEVYMEEKVSQGRQVLRWDKEHPAGHGSRYVASIVPSIYVFFLYLYVIRKTIHVLCGKVLPLWVSNGVQGAVLTLLYTRKDGLVWNVAKKFRTYVFHVKLN